MHRVLFIVAALCLAGLPLVSLQAQEPATGTGIQASGMATIERPAEVMRMQVEILAKSAKDLPDALAKLRTRRTKVEKVLESLGADKKAIAFGELRIDESQDANLARMEMMMHQRLSQRGKKPTKEVVAKPVRVAMRLTAEWRLKEGDATSQLLESKKLQDAIKAADLAGVKETEEQTAEEAEIAEEMEEPVNNWGGQNQAKPGEPQFTFAAKIPAADREKAMADAFRKARTEAEQLAKAAEVGLGRLQSMQATLFPDPENFEIYRQYGSQYRSHSDDAEGYDATGPKPGMLKLRVGVTVSFVIK
ncbi:MAG: hypothetical protein JWP89_1876 [Schlesneria sp.]|nr:hypothetical protein [Schlesneria sp.]